MSLLCTLSNALPNAEVLKLFLLETIPTKLLLFLLTESSSTPAATSGWLRILLVFLLLVLG